MLWNGVMRMPRLHIARCMYASRSSSWPTAASSPVRGAGEAKRYSERAPSWLTDHGTSNSSRVTPGPLR
jgi:hypothetical protein